MSVNNMQIYDLCPVDEAHRVCLNYTFRAQLKFNLHAISRYMYIVCCLFCVQVEWGSSIQVLVQIGRISGVHILILWPIKEVFCLSVCVGFSLRLNRQFCLFSSVFSFVYSLTTLKVYFSTLPSRKIVVNIVELCTVAHCFRCLFGCQFLVVCV